MVNVKVAPLPSRLFSAQMLPPCASMIFLEINNPKPVPVSDFVTNLVNSLGMISGSIPCPVSLILTTMSLALPFETATEMLPLLVNLIALVMRLVTTWAIRDLSASTKVSLLPLQRSTRDLYGYV